MEYRSLGTSAIEIGAISVGTEYLLAASVQETQAVVAAAIDGGSLVGQDMQVAYEQRVASPAGGGAGSPAVQCLAYALSRPGVVAVVPGCASPEHVPDALSWCTVDAVARDFSALLEEHAGTGRGQCTYCNHCLPCPSQIDIGSALRFHDTHRTELSGAPAEVAECIRCGICTRRCPFGVDAVPPMVEMQEALRPGA
ncbi:MAG: hypothetical protein ACOCVK_02225 [bacterium]